MYCILCQAKLLKNKEPHNSYVLLHFSNCYFITVPLMKIKPGTSVYNYAKMPINGYLKFTSLLLKLTQFSVEIKLAT